MMATGRISVVPVVIKLVMKMNPMSILDVGSGFGKWGFLFREYLEGWQGRVLPRAWQKTIDAVEIYAPYAELPWYQAIYNHVYVAPVQRVPVEEYDLVMFGDVIEHIPKEEGRGLLARCKNWIVTTPGYNAPQGQVGGNKHEAHVSRWYVEEFPNSVITDERMIVGWSS